MKFQLLSSTSRSQERRLNRKKKEIRMMIISPLIEFESDPVDHRILFPNQSIHQFNLLSPDSNRVIDHFNLRLDQRTGDSIRSIGFLPIRNHQPVPRIEDWGCMAQIKSYEIMMIDSSNSILRLDLIGTHRFKLINHQLNSTSFDPSSHPIIISFHPDHQISIHPEIYPNPITKSDSKSIQDSKQIIIRFIHLLNTHLNHQPNHDPHDTSLSRFDRTIESLDLPQISFLIDTIVRDLTLIPWDQKFKFLSYYQTRSKLTHFNQTISNLTSQLQSIIYRFQPSFDPIHQFRTLLHHPLKLIQLHRSLDPHQPLSIIDHPPSNSTRFPIFIRSIPRSNREPRLVIASKPSSDSNNPVRGPPAREELDDEIERLKRRIHSIGMSQEAFEICTKELKRLNSIPSSSLDHSLIRNYLEIMLELPWSKGTIDSNRRLILSKSFLSDARHQLDLDHYGMLKLKRRLIEFLAVIKLGAHLQSHSIQSVSQPASSESIPSPQTQSDRLEDSKITRISIDQSDPPKLPIFQPNPSLDQPSTTNSNQDYSDLPQLPILKNVVKEKKRAPILLLVGPPGVGKTSIVKSIAKALGKKFYRISLGGVKDESEIRGHRRTYVGSMPGAIVQALRRVAVNDPVILLDEIDKVGNRSFNGDPASALLEVLDPEQNTSFVDHYINTPIDLSSVLFIATANDTSTISLPLLDRLELVPVDGYLLDEKLEIAKRNLIPKQLEYYRLKPNQLILEDPDRILKRIITGYTHESGVRSLEREIGNLCRAKVLEFVESLGRRSDDHPHGSKKSDGDDFDRFTAKVTFDDLTKILGPEKYETEVSAVKLRPGVAIGLAYQGSGNGSILYIEATSFPGHGALKLTGSLGEVIKESAELAISWIKSHSTRMNLKVKDLNEIDLHIHFPSGSVRKDGPSAGVALVLALVSLLSGIEIDHRLAVTGEISLRGQVLPVGGIREKVLAANRSGIQEIILPHRNAKEIESDPHLNRIPDSMIKIRYVSSLYDLIGLVFKDRQLWIDDDPDHDLGRSADPSIVDPQHRSVLGTRHPFADLHPVDSFDRFIRFSPDSLL